MLDTLYMEFSGIILIMGQKTGRNEDALSFARELGNFLIGIEKELADKYPFSGFGDHASDIASDVVKQAIKMLG